jgi:transposase
MTIHHGLKIKALRCIKDKKANRITTSNIFEISRKSLYNWSKGKYLDKNKRQKVKITPEIKCYIRAYVIKRYNFDYKLLIKAIRKKYHVCVSKSSVYNILKQMKITRKKVYKRTILAKKSVMRRKLKEFKRAIKNISFDDIISVDETSIDTHIVPSMGWAEQGTKIEVTKSNKRVRYTVTCAISYGNIFETQTITNSANAMTFLGFLKNMINKLPTNKITYILLDNARIHHAKIIKSHMSQLNHVQFIYNVPYSPEYNPIERVFSELKAIIKKYTITNLNIVKIIQKSLSKVKSENIISYFKKSLSIT